MFFNHLKEELENRIEDVKVALLLSLLPRRCAVLMGTTVAPPTTSAMSIRPRASKEKW